LPQERIPSIVKERRASRCRASRSAAAGDGEGLSGCGSPTAFSVRRPSPSMPPCSSSPAAEEIERERARTEERREAKFTSLVSVLTEDHARLIRDVLAAKDADGGGRRRCPWATGRRGGGPARRPRARTPGGARLERQRPSRNPDESRGRPYAAVHQGGADYRPRVGGGEVRRGSWEEDCPLHLEGSFYAIDDTCTHRGGPLCEGEVTTELTPPHPLDAAHDE
jgi:hypothetical protein